jgi:hypothetical protein
MNEESRPLVTDERKGLSLRANQLKFKASGKIPIIWRGIYGIYLELIKGTPKDHNMRLVGTWKHYNF